MRFFSNLARKVIGKNDDDTKTPPERTTILPPPKRTVDVIGTPPPVADVLPFPVRAPIDIGPPPGREDAILATMEQTAADQRTYQPDLSSAIIGPNGEIIGAQYPTRAPALPPPTRPEIPIDGTADPIATTPIPPAPVPPVVLGADYRGLSSTQKAAAKLRTLRDAAPESAVRDTGSGYEILPPERMGRGAGAGRGALEMMRAGAPAGPGGMLGASIFGSILGAVSPERIQTLRRQREIGTAENEMARTLGLESQALENETRRVTNASRAADLAHDNEDRQFKKDQGARLEYQQGLTNIANMQKAQSLLDPKSAEYAAASQAIQQEAERLSRRTGRTVHVIPGNPTLNQLPRFEIDGQVIQQGYDGQWKPVYGKPRSEQVNEEADLRAQYEWQTKNAENDAKRTSALQEANDLVAEAEDRQRKISALAGQISTLDAQMAKMSTRDPALGPLKRQRAQLEKQQRDEQSGMDEAYRKAKERQAEAAKYPTMPPPPKRSKKAEATSPTGQSLSKSAWEKSHPGGDWKAAEAEANRRGIPIIP